MASKTQTIQIVGRIKWAKLFGFNRDKSQYSTDTDGVTTLNVFTNKEGRKILKEAGCRIQPKMDDEDDELFYRFKRPWKTDYDWQCGPPAVYNKAGEDWDVEEMGLIGNGSVGIITLSVYETSKGKGTRLEAVQVIKHVKYEVEGDGEGGGGSGYVPRDFTKTEMDLSEFGIDDDDEDDEPAPKPKPKRKAPSKKKAAPKPEPEDDDDDLDGDEIPF